MADVDRFLFADREFYAPWRVKRILQTLRRPIDRPATDPIERTASNKRPAPNEWLEERLIERCDVIAAMKALPWFSRQIVYRGIVLDQPDTHLATVLRCDRETVRRHREDGVEWMARRLGWEGEHETPRQRSPQVWRNPKLDGYSVSRVREI